MTEQLHFHFSLSCSGERKWQPTPVFLLGESQGQGSLVVLEQNLQMLQTFISHRCDGNRNILHACVSVCFPTSNKETKEEEGEIKNYNMIFKRNFGQF